MTFKDWVRDSYDYDTLCDIAQHGANHGYIHITYTAELIDLYDRFKHELWDILHQHAYDCGYTPLEIMAKWNHEITTHIHLATFMVWFGVEFYARELKEGFNHAI